MPVNLKSLISYYPDSDRPGAQLFGMDFLPGVEPDDRSLVMSNAVTRCLLYRSLDWGCGRPEVFPGELIFLGKKLAGCRDSVNAALHRILVALDAGATDSRPLNGLSAADRILALTLGRCGEGATMASMASILSGDAPRNQVAFPARSEFLNMERVGGEDLATTIEARLGSALEAGDAEVFVAQALASKQSEVRHAMRRVLFRSVTGSSEAKSIQMQPVLLRLLEDPNPEVGAVAALGLVDCKLVFSNDLAGNTPRLLGHLMDGMGASDPMVRLRSAQVLDSWRQAGKISPEKIGEWRLRELFENTVLTSIRRFLLSAEEVREMLGHERESDSTVDTPDEAFLGFSEESVVNFALLMEFCEKARSAAGRKFLLALAPMLELADPDLRWCAGLLEKGLILRLDRAGPPLEAYQVRRRIAEETLQATVSALLAKPSTHDELQERSDGHLLSFLSHTLTLDGLTDPEMSGIIFTRLYSQFTSELESLVDGPRSGRIRSVALKILPVLANAGGVPADLRVSMNQRVQNLVRGAFRDENHGLASLAAMVFLRDLFPSEGKRHMDQMRQAALQTADYVAEIASLDDERRQGLLHAVLRKLEGERASRRDHALAQSAPTEEWNATQRSVDPLDWSAVARLVIGGLRRSGQEGIVDPLATVSELRRFLSVEPAFSVPASPVPLPMPSPDAMSLAAALIVVHTAQSQPLDQCVAALSPIVALAQRCRNAGHPSDSLFASVLLAFAETINGESVETLASIEKTIVEVCRSAEVSAHLPTFSASSFSNIPHVRALALRVRQQLEILRTVDPH